MKRGDPRIPIRVWEKISLDEGGCWLWSGSKTDGYGMTLRYSRLDGRSRNVGVHRWLLEVETGTVGEQALHGKCRQRHCVNPEHLRWGNNSENQLDSVEDGTHVWARKTHCPHGHTYSQENTYHTRNGRRLCLTCKRKQDMLRARQFRARIRSRA